MPVIRNIIIKIKISNKHDTKAKCAIRVIKFNRWNFSEITMSYFSAQNLFINRGEFVGSNIYSLAQEAAITSRSRPLSLTLLRFMY